MEQFEIDESSEREAQEQAKIKAFKESKRAAAERFKNRRAAERKDNANAATAIINYLKTSGFWDGLSSEGQTFLLKTANMQASSNQNMFKQLFGESPNIGDTVTLGEAFKKTLKGKCNIDFYVRRWAEKGIVVEYIDDPENVFNSVYKIVSLSNTSN